MSVHPPAGEVPRVLVVCTGNLCRSPLVEALLRGQLEGAGIDAEVSSVGLDAPAAVRPDRRVRRVAGEFGVDLDEHRSRAVVVDDLRRADLILTLTGAHTDLVRSLDPSARGRVVSLRAAAWRARVIGGRPAGFADWVARLAGDGADSGVVRSDPAHDIPDPTGGPLRAYRAMGDEVRALVRVIVEHWSGR